VPLPKPITSLIRTPGSQLESLAKQARKIQQLTTDVHNLLPEVMRKHCIGVGIRDTQLILVTDTAAWATSLRFQTRELLRQLRIQPSFSQLESIRVKVTPRKTIIPVKTENKPPHTTPFTAKLIDSLAKTMTNPNTGKLLQQLAQRIAARHRIK